MARRGSYMFRWWSWASRGVVLALCLNSSSATAQSSAATALNRCLDREVARLAPSLEASDIIGRAALHKCRDELITFQAERGALGDPVVEKLALDGSITRAVEYKVAHRQTTGAKGPTAR